MAAEQQLDATSHAVVPVLSCVLNQLCARNDRLEVDAKAISKFHALRAPAISVEQYLLRIAKYGACSGECFVLALIYIDRVIQANPAFVVNSLNIHRLLITAVMLGAKYFDDQYFNNSYYAKVGGVPAAEINSLEVEFLFMANFNLFVPSDVYAQYYSELFNHACHGNCSCAAAPLPPLLIPPHVYDNVTYDRADARARMDARQRVLEEAAFQEDARQKVLLHQHDSGAPMTVVCVPGTGVRGAPHPPMVADALAVAAAQQAALAQQQQQHAAGLQQPPGQGMAPPAAAQSHMSAAAAPVPSGWAAAAAAAASAAPAPVPMHYAAPPPQQARHPNHAALQRFVPPHLGRHDADADDASGGDSQMCGFTQGTSPPVGAM